LACAWAYFLARHSVGSFGPPLSFNEFTLGRGASE
jgi:hypothetical protein